MQGKYVAHAHRKGFSGKWLACRTARDGPGRRASPLPRRKPCQGVAFCGSQATSPSSSPSSPSDSSLCSQHDRDFSKGSKPPRFCPLQIKGAGRPHSALIQGGALKSRNYDEHATRLPHGSPIKSPPKARQQVEDGQTWTGEGSSASLSLDSIAAPPISCMSSSTSVSAACIPFNSQPLPSKS